MTYARDPYDTDQPPCVCPLDGVPVLTTEEYCPAHGDPDKTPSDKQPDCGTCNDTGQMWTAEEDGTGAWAMACPDCCPECGGTGAVWTDPHECTCGTGPQGYNGMHERGCGSEPCPNGCEYKGESTFGADAEKTADE